MRVFRSSGSMVVIPIFVAAAGLASAREERAAVDPVRPNIILIITDDEGWPHFNFMETYLEETHPGIRREDIPGMPPPGVPLVTPNMDRLAASGAFFPYGMTTAPLCLPSLRGMLTGLYPRHIATHSEGGGMVIDRTRHKILPQFLSEAGYATLQTGKWWEGDPGKWEFTEDTGGYGGIDIIARKTMDPIYQFIQKYHLDPPAAEKKPFFIWFAPHMPHVPQQGFPEEIKELYPPDDRLRPYHAMITWLDRRIGELMAFLDEKGLRENTLILFLNDNGNFIPQSKYVFTANGLRSPVLVSFPGVVPAATRGQLISSLDLLPTILDYAGVPIPADLDGLSLRRLAEGRPTLWRRYLVNHMFNGEASSIWNRDFTLYLEQGKIRKFFDLREDPFEDLNLAARAGFQATYSGQIAELSPVLEDWWDHDVPPPLEPVNQTVDFLRGDASGDGGVDISDAVAVLEGLFLGGALACESAADANDDGGLDLSDAIRLVFSIFGGATPPLPPYPDCGPDPTPDGLNCARGCPALVQPPLQSF